MRAVQLVSSYRRNEKVKQKIFRHVGQGKSDEEIEQLKKLAEFIRIQSLNEKQPVLPLFSPEDVFKKIQGPSQEQDLVDMSKLRSLQIITDGITDIFGTLYTELGWLKLLHNTRKDKVWNQILRSLVLARIANPSSKRKTQCFLSRDLGVKIALDQIYRLMDQLAEQKERIKETVASKTRELFDADSTIFFFDVTTLYFESFTSDELRDNGFSKDAKFKEVQVVLALLTNQEGLPLSYEVFPGNTYEGHTLMELIGRFKAKFNMEKMVVVADRGMFNEDNLLAMEEAEIKYVVGAKIRGLTRVAQNEILTSKMYRAEEIEGEVHWVNEFSHKGRRLIVSYSSKRAEHDGKHRRKLIERLIKKTDDGNLPISQLITNHGIKKYIKIEQEKAKIDEEKIERDAVWDGLHGVVTNLKGKSPRQILGFYRGLWHIEEAFRINKHDLRIRPIFHWTKSRIEGHIVLCFVAYALVKHAQFRLKIQAEAISVERLREELLAVQTMIVEEISTGKKYCIPSGLQRMQKKIYQIFGLKRKEVPQRIVGSR